MIWCREANKDIGKLKDFNAIIDETRIFVQALMEKEFEDINEMKSKADDMLERYVDEGKF
jgi:hypothetical protein